ncbi:hypothetical protein AHAS_Ahas19G0272600 [Arachis hypogaea]|uniref:PPM-type phosphatase domain-containing protein n=1 Tax=Arachis hypogaea TaxID=3818 RepID=A0A444XRN2_ARAHY|nr:hypothetical protein Ahy_B09g098617 [Arachis hypogaea]
MGSKDSNDSMVAIQLIIDLKPDLPREAERIKRCKGRVFALQDEPEVPRVWLPFDDAPGLAMARAFGDFCLKDYGVIFIPEFSHRLLTDKDEFIVLASDGVRLSKIYLLLFVLVVSVATVILQLSLKSRSIEHLQHFLFPRCIVFSCFVVLVHVKVIKSK